MTTKDACPVCGAGDHHCAGNVPTKSRMVIDINGTRRVSGPLRVPRQVRTIGKPGYVGAVEEYDRRYPNITLVPAPDELEAPEPMRPETLDEVVAGARQMTPEAADVAQVDESDEEPLEAVDSASAPAQAASGARKEDKRQPADKSRKDGAGSKK